MKVNLEVGAAHRLNLRDGDVVELVGWQHGSAANQNSSRLIGRVYTLQNGWLCLGQEASIDLHEVLSLPKGRRPLFHVISRASWAVDGMGGTIQQPQTYTRAQIERAVIMGHSADNAAKFTEQKPDEVIKKYAYVYSHEWLFGTEQTMDDTHRFTLTFTAGSDTGTVVKEKL